MDGKVDDVSVTMTLSSGLETRRVKTFSQGDIGNVVRTNTTIPLERGKVLTSSNAKAVLMSEGLFTRELDELSYTKIHAAKVKQIVYAEITNDEEGTRNAQYCVQGEGMSCEFCDGLARHIYDKPLPYRIYVRQSGKLKYRMSSPYAIDVEVSSMQFSRVLRRYSMPLVFSRSNSSIPYLTVAAFGYTTRGAKLDTENTLRLFDCCPHATNEQLLRLFTSPGIQDHLSLVLDVLGESVDKVDMITDRLQLGRDKLEFLLYMINNSSFAASGILTSVDPSGAAGSLISEIPLDEFERFVLQRFSIAYSMTKWSILRDTHSDPSVEIDHYPLFEFTVTSNAVEGEVDDRVDLGTPLSTTFQKWYL